MCSPLVSQRLTGRGPGLRCLNKQRGPGGVPLTSDGCDESGLLPHGGWQTSTRAQEELCPLCAELAQGDRHQQMQKQEPCLRLTLEPTVFLQQNPSPFPTQSSVRQAGTTFCEPTNSLPDQETPLLLLFHLFFLGCLHEHPRSFFCWFQPAHPYQLSTVIILFFLVENIQNAAEAMA